MQRIACCPQKTPSFSLLPALNQGLRCSGTSNPSAGFRKGRSSSDLKRKSSAAAGGGHNGFHILKCKAFVLHNVPDSLSLLFARTWFQISGLFGTLQDQVSISPLALTSKVAIFPFPYPGGSPRKHKNRNQHASSQPRLDQRRGNQEATEAFLVWGGGREGKHVPPSRAPGKGTLHDLEQFGVLSPLPWLGTPTGAGARLPDASLLCIPWKT